MTNNVGFADRVVRIILGLALLAFAYFGLETYGTYAYLGWIGVIPLVTGLIGSCPVYSAFGIDTCGRSHA